MNDVLQDLQLMSVILKDGNVKFKDSSLDEWRKNSWKTFSKEKGMILYFSNPEQKDMPADDYAFFQKILSAIKVDLEQIAIINVDFVHLPFYEVVNKVDPKRFICLGIAPKRVQLHIEPRAYQVCKIDSREILFGHSLKQIAADQQLKKHLWVALQEMFLK